MEMKREWKSPEAILCSSFSDIWIEMDSIKLISSLDSYLVSCYYIISWILKSLHFRFYLWIPQKSFFFRNWKRFWTSDHIYMFGAYFINKRTKDITSIDWLSKLLFSFVTLSYYVRPLNKWNTRKFSELANAFGTVFENSKRKDIILHKQIV